MWGADNVNGSALAASKALHRVRLDAPGKDSMTSAATHKSY